MTNDRKRNYNDMLDDESIDIKVRRYNSFTNDRLILDKHIDSLLEKKAERLNETYITITKCIKNKDEGGYRMALNMYRNEECNICRMLCENSYSLLYMNSEKFNLNHIFRQLPSYYTLTVKDEIKKETTEESESQTDTEDEDINEEDEEVKNAYNTVILDIMNKMKKVAKWKNL